MVKLYQGHDGFDSQQGHPVGKSSHTLMFSALGKEPVFKSYQTYYSNVIIMMCVWSNQISSWRIIILFLPWALQLLRRKHFQELNPYLWIARKLCHWWTYGPFEGGSGRGDTNILTFRFLFYLLRLKGIGDYLNFWICRV